MGVLNNVQVGKKFDFFLVKIFDDELTIQMIDWLYIYIYIYERYATSITFLQQITCG